MKIMGLQKMTLLDYPGLVACTVFLGGCNLRCPFCHNASLVLPERKTEALMSQEELLQFLQGRKGKLDGVCVTGGEPTLYGDLPLLLRQIRQLGFRVKLDTNGSRPQVLRKLMEEGLLDYVAMDIKNSPARYAETCGGADILDAVRESASLLMNGNVEYEFRTTAVCPLHRPEDLEQIGRWLKGASKYFIQGFVDSGDLIGSGLRALERQEMEALLHAVLPYIPQATLRGI